MRRRTFIGTTAGLGAALLAGCSGGDGTDTDSGGDDGSGDGGSTDAAGTEHGFFRLLISDQPAAIEDFDSLQVSFAKARVFRGDGADTEMDDGKETPANETVTPVPITNGTAASPTSASTATANETVTTERASTEPTADSGTTLPETGSPAGAEETAGADGNGFIEIELEGTTVDLTQVVGEKAIGVFDGELPAGAYSKVELHVSDVKGLVDGEEVAVKIPSEKLQIVKPFDVRVDESVSFVFDINVVKKGNGGYNLLPVISESGVSGRDVDVEEVDGEMKTPDDTNMSNGDGRNGNESDGAGS